MEIINVDGVLVVNLDPFGKGGPGSGRYPAGSSGGSGGGRRTGTGSAIVGYSDAKDYTDDQLAEEWYKNVDDDDKADYISVIEEEMDARGYSDPNDLVDQYNFDHLDE